MPTFYEPISLDTSGLEAWASHLASNPSKIGYLPQGLYDIGSTVDFVELSNRRILCGNQDYFDNPGRAADNLSSGVVFQWTGTNATGPMLKIDRCLGLWIDSIQFMGTSGKTPTVAVSVRNTVSYGSQRHRFDRWQFYNVTSAIEFGEEASPNENNNDVMLLNEPHFANCDYCYTTWGYNSLVHSVNNVNANNCGVIFRPAQGGHIISNVGNTSEIDTIIQVGQGGGNALLAVALTGWRIEGQNRANDEACRWVYNTTAADIAQVDLYSCVQGTHSFSNSTRYLFDVYGGVRINVWGGQLRNRVARLRGVTGKTCRCYLNGVSIDRGNDDIYTIDADPAHFITRDCHLNTNTSLAPLARTSN